MNNSAFIEKVGDSYFTRILEKFIENRNISLQKQVVLNILKNELQEEMFGFSARQLIKAFEQCKRNGYIICVKYDEKANETDFLSDQNNFYVQKIIEIYDKVIQEQLNKMGDEQ